MQYARSPPWDAKVRSFFLSVPHHSMELPLLTRTDPVILNAMKEIMRIASYADDLPQDDIPDGLRSVEDICERTLAQYPNPYEEDPA
jgi:hypothetical protein